ncbi:MAG: adenylyl-sulfate kinase [Nanoarchaeota archaeon]
MNINLDELFEKLKEIGDEILKIYNSDFSYESKDDNSPLTKADMLSHEMLKNYLKKITNYPILSEESKNFQTDDENQKIWIIDPLDGTKDFIGKTDEFSIMIALIENKKPILGIVYVPALDIIYYAQRGMGAKKIENNIETKLEVSNKTLFKDSRVIVSRNNIREEDKSLLNKLGVKNYKQMGSVGIKFGEIAKGSAELCFYTTSKIGIWDCAPSHIILKEAGGDVFDNRGLDPTYDLKNKKMKNGFFGTNSYLDKNKILKALNFLNGFVLWFTGLSGAGKTTLANEVSKNLYSLDIVCQRLNGDEMREHITSDLTYNREDRIKNIKRVSYIANLLSKNNIKVVADFITPYREMREYLRDNICNYIEVFVYAPLEECEKRDIKGLYKRAREGKIEHFTGIDDRFDNPIKPHIIVNTKEEEIEQSVEKILNYLKKNKFF